MHFFDPQRPRIGDRPAYGQADGMACPMAALPGLYLRPQPDGSWELEAMLRAKGDGHAWFRFEVQEEDLLDILRMYREDPEKCLLHFFKWSYVNEVKKPDPPPRPRLAPAPMKITLADLGLGRKPTP